MNTFLPKDYEAPKTNSNYFRFEKGANKFRILSSAIIGWQYWTKENKPVRSKTQFTDIPDDARLEEGQFKPKHFWAFVVLNRQTNNVQIMEITQKTIQKEIKALVDDEDWGDPKGYDIVITKTGEKLDTDYQVNSKPHSKIEIPDISHIDLTALYKGEDPFGTKTDVVVENDPFNMNSEE